MTDINGLNDIKLGVIGGDTRQLAMAEALAAEGFEVAVYGFDKYDGGLPSQGVTQCATVSGAISGSAAVILPLPYSADDVNVNMTLSEHTVKLSELFPRLTSSQLIFGGNFRAPVYELAKNASLRMYDYYDREETAVLNAIPTAEGAVALAMNELPITIHGCRAAVFGFGRVGKLLSRTLSALGASVCVYARGESDLAWIRALGYRAVKLIGSPPEVSADVIFNTVPTRLLNREFLERLDRRTLVIDLSSKPGGVDFPAAKELGIKVLWALSLPGRVAPVSSGLIIKESIMNILRGEGVIV